ncbi:Os09g0355850 [Oryza sativa Japonica Group]|uniref:Os09g0355850 protein n=1 Tax=Oryza sativa subsp. japonica TaxID=39947 RepID=A0A0N7KQM9_ORYSJ|nr:Os09g0355850 [Oryza sativa Japonica Group]
MNNPAFQGTSTRPQRTFSTQTFTSRTLDRRSDRITAVAAQISKGGACDGAVGAPSGGGKPLVTGITKDGATKLYTIVVKDGHPLALDLSGELVWSTCDASRSTVLPYECECVEIILSSSLWGPHKARRRGGGGGRAGSSHGWSINFGICRPNLFLHWLLRSSSRANLYRHRRPALEIIVLATAGVTEEEEETTKPAMALLRLSDV